MVLLRGYRLFYSPLAQLLYSTKWRWIFLFLESTEILHIFKIWNTNLLLKISPINHIPTMFLIQLTLFMRHCWILASYTCMNGYIWWSMRVHHKRILVKFKLWCRMNENMNWHWHTVAVRQRQGRKSLLFLFRKLTVAHLSPSWER